MKGDFTVHGNGSGRRGEPGSQDPGARRLSRRRWGPKPTGRPASSRLRITTGARAVSPRPGLSQALNLYFACNSPREASLFKSQLLLVPEKFV